MFGTKRVLPACLTWKLWDVSPEPFTDAILVILNSYPNAELQCSRSRVLPTRMIWDRVVFILFSLLIGAWDSWIVKRRRQRLHHYGARSYQMWSWFITMDRSNFADLDWYEPGLWLRHMLDRSWPGSKKDMTSEDNESALYWKTPRCQTNQLRATELT